MTKDFSADELAILREHLRKNIPGIVDDKLQEELEKLISTPDEARKILDNHQANDTLTVSDQLPEATPEDGNWKKEVRDAIQKANDELEYKFTENKEDTKHLTFKDGENIISFSSPNNAYVEGEQKAFDELVVAAKKMGKTSIQFGKFEKHPEYKAMLCLACLKYDMAISNPPKLDDLKDNPQAKEALKGIISLYSQEADEELAKAKTNFLKAVSTPTTESDKELQKLFHDIQKAKKDSQNSEEIRKLEEQIKKHSLGEALYKAINEKAKTMKIGLKLGIISEDEVKSYSSTKSSQENDVQRTFKGAIDQNIIRNALNSSTSR